MSTARQPAARPGAGTRDDVALGIERREATAGSLRDPVCSRQVCTLPAARPGVGGRRRGGGRVGRVLALGRRQASGLRRRAEDDEADDERDGEQRDGAERHGEPGRQ